MTVRVDPPSVLTMLVDGLRNMAHEIDNAGALEHRRGAAAARYFEFEILPLLVDLDATTLTNAIAEAALKDHHRLNGARRVTLPMNSGMLCPPRQQVELTTRAQDQVMKIERLVIPDEIAQCFTIHDIRIGNRPQFLQAGAVSAMLFAQSAPEPRPISYDVVQVAMDVVIVVEYTGDHEEGIEFESTAIGISSENRYMNQGDIRRMIERWQNQVDEIDASVTPPPQPAPQYQNVNAENRVMGAGTRADPRRTPIRPANNARIVPNVTPRR